MPRKRTVALASIVGVVGLCIAFLDPVYSAYCTVTGRPQSWMQKSSPLRDSIEDVWKQWRRDDISRTDAVERLSRIVRDELPEGSTDADVRAHIKRHFKNPSLHSIGAQPATQYRQDAYGYSNSEDTWILNVRYFTRHEEFLYADLHMSRPKGTDLRSIFLTPKVDLWPSVPPPKTTSSEQVVEPDAGNAPE